MSPATRVMDPEEYRQAAQAGRAPTDAVLRMALNSEVRALATQRRVQFRITTGAVDRMKDTIDPAGWDLKNYKKSPVVLWAHRYDELPIAKAVEITADPKGLSAVAEFATKEQYAFADTVYQLLLGGFLGATSVGFKPQKHVYNEQRGGVDFLEQELLEFSVVPIPANPEALVEGKAFDLDLDPLRTWLARQGGGARPGWRRVGEPAILLIDDRGVPGNVSTETAPESTPWSAPSLKDFTGKAWGDLSTAEKRDIAGHYAWCKTGTMPETFGDLALPHHRASDGQVVWHGVRAAMARANQVQGGNTDAIMAHLKAHARAFGKGLDPEMLRYMGGDVVTVDPHDLAAAFRVVVDDEIVRTYNKLRGRVD